MKVYVASSWRNQHQQRVVGLLRSDGHTVYDFRDSSGFHWSSIDPAWKTWSKHPRLYFDALQHPLAERGFNRDMEALEDADVCVYVTPCGVSASFEAGWARGAGKWVYAYVPEFRDAELMVKMAHLVTSDLDRIRTAVTRSDQTREASPFAGNPPRESLN